MLYGICAAAAARRLASTETSVRLAVLRRQRFVDDVTFDVIGFYELR
jgi:hypothetical protein